MMTDVVECAMDHSCEVINLSDTSSKSQKTCAVINSSDTSSTSKKYCEDGYLSNTSLTKQNILPQANTKKKQKHEKSERKIILNKEESFSLFCDQARPNLKCVISGRCRREKHKCRKKHDKPYVDSSKSDKPSKSLDKTNCITTSLPEQKPHKRNIDSFKSKTPKTQDKTNYLKSSLHIPEQYKEDRIQPCCFRYKCNPEFMAAQKRSCRTTPVSKKIKKLQNTKEHLKRNYNGSKKHRQEKLVCSERNKKLSKDDACIGLSPISMSPLPESISSSLNISYEDISMDSFTTQSEDALDTLIKRAKERERSVVYGSNLHKLSLPLTFQDRPRTSTPYMHNYDNEDGSTVYTADMDLSINSLSTLILTPNIGTEVYSPTMSPTDFCNNRRNSQDTLKFSDCEIEAHPKREPYSSSTSPGRVICPEYFQKTKKETLRDMKICINTSTRIKEENFELVEVKRELRTPSPMIYNDSERMISELKGIKEEKDSNSNYNYGPISQCTVKSESQVQKTLKIESV